MSLYALNGVAEHFVSAIGQAFWQGGIAILLVWGLCKLWPGMSASLRCWLWRLACAEFGISLLCTDGVPLPVLPRVFASAPTNSDVVLSPCVGLLALWLLGVLIGSLNMARSWKRSRCLLGDCKPVESEKAVALCAEVCARFGWKRSLRLVQSEAVTTPLLIGMRRPTVVLPARLLSDSSQEELTMILAHELAHVLRRDLYWIWLPAFTSTLFFFQPLVRLACAEWQVDQEIACDVLAIRVMQMRASEYGRMLLQQATWNGSTEPLFASVSLFDCAATLKRRIFALPSSVNEPLRWQKFVTASLILFSMMALLPWRFEVSPAPFVPCTHSHNRRLPVPSP